MCGHDDRFFVLHLILGGKLDICGRDDLFFALPIRAALGIKIFSNAAFCVKRLPMSGLAYMLRLGIHVYVMHLQLLFISIFNFLATDICNFDLPRRTHDVFSKSYNQCNHQENLHEF